ncbi:MULTISPECIES: hypothetical protein [Streptomyces]|uniref:hypothetical protein n=1 Tax=Streptomyces TaxID=1883 RepID=UPI00167B2704|nr:MULTISPECIES: hypothetical protein [Streptomyces]MBD3575449.1 hypothetical protein [Streptomyces sp. KD18]
MASVGWVPGLGVRPSPVRVKVVVVVVVAVATAVLAVLGQDPGTSLAVIVMVTTTGLELARRISGGDGGDADGAGPVVPPAGR